MRTNKHTPTHPGALTPAQLTRRTLDRIAAAAVYFLLQVALAATFTIIFLITH